MHSPKKPEARPLEPQIFTGRVAAGRLRDTLVACVHGSEPLSDADNERLLAELASPEVGKVLVHVASTAHPTPRQRGRMAEVLRARPGDLPRVALLCDSMVIRGVITAVEWMLNQKLAKAFASHEIRDALSWLEHDDPATIVHALQCFDAALRVHGAFASSRRATHVQQYGRGDR